MTQAVTRIVAESIKAKTQRAPLLAVAKVSFFALLLAGCAANQPGTNTGAAVGALGGALVGGLTSKSVWGALGGAALGGVIGGVTGSIFDRINKDQMQNAVNQACAVNQPVTYQDSAMHHQVMCTPAPMQVVNGQVVRTVSLSFWDGNRRHDLNGTATQSPDGRWIFRPNT